jgi:demethylmenaquinone methyltransferase/2-methoxy-6-polyprenyl-1,4-benzoquinol methylase
MKEEKNSQYYAYISKVFKRWAPIYDYFAQIFIFRLRDKVVEVCNPAKDAKILDLCTGTGEQALAFGKKGYTVIGIDISLDMLIVANMKNKYKTVGFKMADAANLPFSDNYFDITTISFGLHEMPLHIMEKVLLEIKRVTKTKGKIVIIDYTLPKNAIIKFLGYHYIKLFESKYYADFIKIDFDALLKKFEIQIEHKIPVILGLASIYSCIKER